LINYKIQDLAPFISRFYRRGVRRVASSSRCTGKTDAVSKEKPTSVKCSQESQATT